MLVGSGAHSSIGGVFRDELWVELNLGEFGVWGANCGSAAVVGSGDNANGEGMGDGS